MAIANAFYTNCVQRHLCAFTFSIVVRPQITVLLGATMHLRHGPGAFREPDHGGTPRGCQVDRTMRGVNYRSAQRT